MNHTSTSCRILTGKVNADLCSACRKVDPCLWTTRRRFGVAGGPDEIVLTDEGNAKAFSVGARVRRGQASEALEALASAGGHGLLSVRVDGARYRATELGRFDQVAWGHLRALGYVESTPPEQDKGIADGVRLTDAGRHAVENGKEERIRLLERCSAAADLPFGFKSPEQLMEPFCACGRVVSMCDGSRKGCVRK